MSKKSEWHFLDDTKLWMLIAQAGYPGAPAAHDRVKDIKKLGHTPAIFYSEFNEFIVIDESDPKEAEWLRSIRAKAKPFRM